jgi:cell shape-determining protein MreC
MNPFEMVVAIVVVVTVGRVIMARYGVVSGKKGETIAFRDDSATRAENERLRDELRGMKERLAVLERLATDNDTSSARLDREIEKLRDQK